MKEYSENSTLKQIMDNPFGKDVLTQIAGMVGFSTDALTRFPLGGMKLSALERLSGDTLDRATVRMLCNKLNEYARLPEVDKDAPSSPKWWKETVFYQIYPVSFCDSNGDGIGDLRGIIHKLDYLKELGVGALWLSPVYRSPWDDNGYDISDYRHIREQFGTLGDFRALLSGAHERGMKVVMDLVVNHTSDEHEWFKKASASRDSEYRDYYIWSSGKKGGTPNNWRSMFSGSAWKYFDNTDSWCLHTFSSKQMDLNWKNPRVRDEVYDIINYWYDMGVDGFRMDVINMIDKPDGLPDANERLGALAGCTGAEYYFFGSRAHAYLRELNTRTAKGRDVATIGETPGIGMELARYFTAESRQELGMVFGFEHLYESGKPRGSGKPLSLTYLRDTLLKWQLGYGDACWNSLFTDNHDNPRMLSRIDSRPDYREALAKLLAVLLLTLRGTPFIYQGQELGMTNCEFSGMDEMRDVEALNYYKENKEGLPEDKLLNRVRAMTRDHARTPMQWEGGEKAGFTSGEPWIKVNPNCAEINAEAEQKDPDSVLNFYKELIKLRNSDNTLAYGAITVADPRKELFCYTRTRDGVGYYIELNLSDREQKRHVMPAGPLLLSNYAGTEEKLRPYEANVYRK